MWKWMCCKWLFMLSYFLIVIYFSYMYILNWFNNNVTYFQYFVCFSIFGVVYGVFEWILIWFCLLLTEIDMLIAASWFIYKYMRWVYFMLRTFMRDAHRNSLRVLNLIPEVRDTSFQTTKEVSNKVSAPQTYLSFNVETGIGRIHAMKDALVHIWPSDKDRNF